MPEEPVILLAEDREDDIVLIQKAFARSTVPCALRVVRNGEEVVAYLGGEGPYSDRDRYPLPALLLLDLKMPRMDGFEVLEWIRQQPGLFAFRVIVLTSSQVSEDVNRAYEAGANSFLVKPADFGDYMQLTEFINGFWLQFNSTPQSTTKG